MLVNGWGLFAYPLFTQQLERLISRVDVLARNDPSTYERHPATKLLATIRRYVMELIPKDPNAAEFRQGNTLGRDNRHWFRAKFHERYRLFYRFSSQHKVIIYAWVNDEHSLRKAGSKRDPYAMFQEMLASGNPPGDMQQLIQASKEILEPRSAVASSKRRSQSDQKSRRPKS
jgi:toxin YhaV